MDVVAIPPRNVVVAELGWARDVGQSRVVVSAWIVVIGGYVPMVRHSAKVDLISIGESAIEGISTVVPFSGTPRLVACLAQYLAEHGVIIGDTCPGILQMKQRSSGMQHGATGHTDGTMRAAGNVCLGKGCTAGYEAVTVRRMNPVVAQCSDCVEPLIIGEKYEHIRLTHELLPFVFGWVNNPQTLPV